MLEFYAALTDGPSVFRRTLKLIDDLYAPPPNTFSRVLSTPLKLNAEALTILRNLKEERGATVCFDSGGYYVQVGKIEYYSLYLTLLETYRKHPWADAYVLPDHVPTSQDSPQVVDAKVRETVQFSTLFLSEMPDALRER